jgi:4-hydroxybenzoate polyprenyltransferase
MIALNRPDARRLTATCLFTLAALVAWVTPSPALAHTHGDPSRDLSAASGLSLSVPIALSVAAPSAVLVAGAAFTVVAIQTVAEGTVWVLERASDGARFSVQFGSEAAGALSVGIGASVVTTAVAAGWVLSAAGEVVAFIPNELGRALLHNERVTR